MQKLTTEERKWNFLQKLAFLILKDFLTEINLALKKSNSILHAFEVLTVDNLKQQNNLVYLFETSIRVLANFYGAEQVDEFQGKESKVHVIIDKEEVMKELSNFLLDSNDTMIHLRSCRYIYTDIVL